MVTIHYSNGGRHIMIEDLQPLPDDVRDDVIDSVKKFTKENSDFSLLTETKNEDGSTSCVHVE